MHGTRRLIILFQVTLAYLLELVILDSKGTPFSQIGCVHNGPLLLQWTRTQPEDFSLPGGFLVKEMVKVRSQNGVSNNSTVDEKTVPATNKDPSGTLEFFTPANESDFFFQSFELSSNGSADKLIGESRFQLCPDFRPTTSVSNPRSTSSISAGQSSDPRASPTSTIPNTVATEPSGFPSNSSSPVPSPSKRQIGQIIGGVIGGFCGFLVGIAFAMYCLRRRKLRRRFNGTVDPIVSEKQLEDARLQGPYNETVARTDGTRDSIPPSYNLETQGQSHGPSDSMLNLIQDLQARVRHLEGPPPSYSTGSSSL